MYDAFNWYAPGRDNDDQYYVIQHGLKREFDPHVDISAPYLCSPHDSKSELSTTWPEVGIVPFYGSATTNGLSVDKTISFFVDSGTSKIILNREVYGNILYYINTLMHTEAHLKK